MTEAGVWSPSARPFRLARLHEHDPDSPCDQTTLEPIQWKLLQRKIIKGALMPSRALSIRASFISIVKLEGYVNGDLDPDPEVISRCRRWKRHFAIVNDYRDIPGQS